MEERYSKTRMVGGRTIGEHMRKRNSMLQQERSAFDGHWQTLAENMLPRLSRFFVSDRNRGGDRNQNIIDNAATKALRVLTAGMMAGMTSPARPWFRLTLPDEDLAMQAGPSRWLSDVRQILLRIFHKSNTYPMLQGQYRELGGFGTGLALVDNNFDNVIHHTLMTVGEYRLGLNDLGYVDTAYHEFELTVKQAVEWFGLDNLSMRCNSDYANGNYENAVRFLRAVEPRSERNSGNARALHMPWRSAYLEISADNRDTVVREGGYRSFPGLAPRWDVLYNDTYGSSPGMEALGDMLQLQQQQHDKSKAIAYMADPPLQIPTRMRGQENDFLPGGVSYYDQINPSGGVRTLFETKLDINALLVDIQDVRGRIDSAFYADMFLMLANADKTNMTATEVAERHEEKLLMIGPTLERLHKELIYPLIELAFEKAVEANIIPPPPEEMDQMPIEIEPVSMLAQAQKAVAVGSIDRLLGHIGTVAQAKGDPSVWDKYDSDLSIDRYSDMLGVDPDIIVSNKDVAIIRSQRAQEQAAATAAEQANNVADTAAKLGTVDTGGTPNAASDILNLFSGYQSPSGVEL